MGQEERLGDYLTEKLEILEKMIANTETQSRFIHKREMRGLRRILREREALLGKLLAVNNQLTIDQGWKNSKQLMAVQQAIADRQAQLLKQSSQVITQAVTERTRIAAELNSSRMAKNLQNRYANPWATVSQGSRLNAKG